MPTGTGADTTVNYLWEDNGFAADPTDSTHKTVGSEARLTQNQGSHNAVEVFPPGSRTPDEIIEQAFDGSFNLQFSLTNPWWNRMIFGSPSTTDNGDGSHTHTYDGTEGSRPVPSSFRLVEGHYLGGVERILKGCVVTQLTVRARVNGNVEVTLRGAYAKEGDNDPASITDQVDTSERTMTFAQANLKVDGTIYNVVQQASLEVQANVEIKNELGTRFGVDYSPKGMRFSVDFERLEKSGEYKNDLEDFYGGSTDVQEKVTNTKPMTLLFDNGDAAGSGINKLEYSLTSSKANTFGESGIGDSQADLSESINRMATGIEAKGTNETASAP